MINSIFETLKMNNSRLFKEDVLKHEKDNELLVRVIKMALDPFTQFYIRKIPAYNSGIVYANLVWALNSLESLSSREITGNAAIEHLTKILEAVSASDAKVIERIIQKDLDCGVSVATVNKIWKNLIPEYPVMLASPFEQKLVDKITFPAYSQEKLDGMRFNAVVINGVVEYRSRNGKEIQIIDPSFAIPFIEMANGKNIVFDGELLIRGKDGKYLDRKTGNGILNKAVKGTISKEESEMVCAVLWDEIDYDSFILGVDNTPYEDRLRMMTSRVMHVSNDRVNTVRTKVVNSIDEIKEHFQSYLDQGLEGTIVKPKNMIWENKRSKSQIKFKGELECDLEVVGWEEGTGKYAGRLGALVLSSSDGVIKVNVGTGFTDADRDRITLDSCIGSVVAIKYNARITDKKTGNHSLFLPVFIEQRTDKTVADHSNDIK